MIAIIEMVLVLLMVFLLGILIGIKIENIVAEKNFKEFYRIFNEMNDEWYRYCSFLYNRCKELQGECDGCKRCEGDGENA